MYVQVREAQLAQYNYILVLGEEEKRNGTVNVRTRDNQVGGHSRMVWGDMLGPFQESDRVCPSEPPVTASIEIGFSTVVPCSVVLRPCRRCMASTRWSPC